MESFLTKARDNKNAIFIALGGIFLLNGYRYYKKALQVESN